MPNIQEQIERNFSYHPPDPEQIARYKQIREIGKDFAELLAALTPASREQSLAITHLEEVVMWANAAIARNEPHND